MVGCNQDVCRHNIQVCLGLWYTDTYPEEMWIEGWVEVARRYLDNPWVAGMDLR